MDTKEKILLTAAEEFANKGYHATTIRDICHRAKVNLAAVNYHFSSKAILYEQVFEYLFLKTEEEYPKTINLEISTEDEWFDEIKSLINRLMRKCTSNNKYERYLHAIFAREELNTSANFDSIYKKLFSPRLDDIKTLFSYSDINSEEELNICVLSVISIILIFSEKKSLVGQFTGNPNFGLENLDLIVDNLLSGIKASLKFKGLPEGDKIEN